MINCDVNFCSVLESIIWITLWDKTFNMEKYCDLCGLSEGELELLHCWILFCYGIIKIGDICQLVEEQPELGKSRAVLIWVTPQLKYL